MGNTTEHNYDENDKCQSCELSKEQIEDRKIIHCKGKRKSVASPNTKSPTKNYI
jgi:hypothetical protein